METRKEDFSFARDISEYQRDREFGQAGFDIVSLDGDFPLFRSERTVDHREPHGEYPEVPRFMSSVMLDTDGLLPPLPMTITTDGVWKTKAFAVTPFTPGAGYPVDRDDFDAGGRAAKTSGLMGSGALTDHPLNLRIGSAAEMCKERGITLTDEDALRILRALRVQLAFPSGIRLESRPQAASLREGELFFNRFYPSDTGPLKQPEGNMRWLDEGLQLALPADLAALQRIDGRFTLDSETLRHRSL